MKTLNIDIETFSDIDIKTGGLYKYVQSPDFQILLFAYSIDGAPVEIIDLAQGEKLPALLFNSLFDESIEKRAYNAPFEWYCLSKYVGQYLPLNQWSCTMHHGLYLGYPAGLAAIGKAIGLPQDKQKMGIGLSLIRKFCIPRKPTKTDPRTRILPHHEPEKWNLFKDYCKQDVRTEMEVKRLLEPFPIPQSEKELWALDQKINLFGVRADTELIDGALYCSNQITNELMSEAQHISGLDNPKSVQQLTKWLEDETGEEVENLQKATVSSMIKNLDDGKAKRMLEIRQELSKTSVKKYTAMQNAICADGRIRGLLQFYGANRTGRWAGRLVQVQNLPRNYISTLELARELVKKKDIEALKLIYGNVPDTLSQLIRTAFISSDNKKYYVSDFSAIEARVIAYIANEQWRLDVFRTHGKIYEASASAMFGVPIEKIKKGNPEYDLRQKGKIAELALGYQGGVGALKAMGALDMGLSEDELPDIVARWRASNKRIVDLWFQIDNASLNTVMTGIPQMAGRCIFAIEGHFLTIKLPSGRKLYYPNPHIKENKFGKPAIHYYGIEQGTKSWGELSTYGGKLTENIVQAMARDCLAYALINVNDAGYDICMHVHDEIIAEHAEGDSVLDEMNRILSTPIPWADGLLLKGDGFSNEFYKKE